MDKNSYKQRTPRLGIPVPGYEQPIWPELELKKWTLVENILIAAMRGSENCVFYEGRLSLDKQKDGTFAVQARRSSHGHSLCGIVGGHYFDAPKTLEWPELLKGQQYYLYITPTEKTSLDPTSVRPVTLKFYSPTPSRLLVGYVDLRKDKPKVDVSPEGKVYASRLTVPPVMMAPHVVKFETNGLKGAVLSVPGRVAFAEVSRDFHEDVTSSKIGEVMFGYNGTDSRAERPGDVVVYNTGDLGLPARAIIFTE